MPVVDRRRLADDEPAMKISDDWTLSTHEMRSNREAVRQQTVFSSLYLTKRSSETTISALADALVHR